MQCQNRCSTAFSPTFAQISVATAQGGAAYHTFTADEIISFSYNGNCPDYGASGVCTSSVSITVANLTPNTAAVQKDYIITSISAAGCTFGAYFIISDMNYDRYTTTITAYDFCSKLDKEFNNSSFAATEKNQKNEDVIKLYTETQMLTAMNLQVTGASIGSIGGAERYSKDDMSGTCRSILETTAAVTGRMWAANSGNSIVPHQFGDYIPGSASGGTAGGNVSISEYSERYDYSSGTPGNIILYDTTNAKEYKDSMQNVFKYVDSGLVKGEGQVYSNLKSALNKQYGAFKVIDAIIAGSVAMPLDVAITENGGTIHKTARNVSARLTAGGMLCELSADEMKLDSRTYKPREKREDKKAVKKGETVGKVFLDANFSGISFTIPDQNGA